jgi:hypothetical protein
LDVIHVVKETQRFIKHIQEDRILVRLNDFSALFLV